MSPCPFCAALRCAALRISNHATPFYALCGWWVANQPIWSLQFVLQRVRRHERRARRQTGKWAPTTQHSQQRLSVLQRSRIYALPSALLPMAGPTVHPVRVRKVGAQFRQYPHLTHQYTHSFLHHIGYGRWLSPVPSSNLISSSFSPPGCLIVSLCQAVICGSCSTNCWPCRAEPVPHGLLKSPSDK